MFEVQDLKYATLATVSRCGMVWFSEDVLSTDMIDHSCPEIALIFIFTFFGINKCQLCREEMSSLGRFSLPK